MISNPEFHYFVCFGGYMLKLRSIALIVAAATTSAPAFASTDKAELVTVPPAPAGKALVVFYRPGGYAGSLISCAVSEDGKTVSSLPPKHYFILIAEPGRHTYSVASESIDKVVLTLKPGETMYTRCGVTLGIFAGRPKLEVTIEQDFTSKEWKSVRV